MFLLLYPESREQLWRKRQIQGAAPGPGSPTKTQGLGSVFHGAKPKSLGFQRPLPVPGHYCFSAPGEMAADRHPDDSIEGIWGAGGGKFHPDVASDGLPPNPGDPMAPHFTLLEAVVIQLLSILPTAHPWAGPQHSSGNRGRLEERAARTAKAGQELK